MDRIEELLKAPCWIIDILPMRVPKDSPGQFFAVEKYLLREREAAVRQKHIDMILKLNCYLDVEIDGEKNPAPARIAEIMTGRDTYILVKDAMIVACPDDTHMTLFHPDEGLLALVKTLASGEGLFVWKGMDG